MADPVAKRHKWRLACEIVAESRSQRAIVLDLSKTGLFVQTSARLTAGADVEVWLQIPGAASSVVIQARVARAKHVPAQLTSVARGGVGLRIRSAPQTYFQALAKLEEEASLSGAAPSPDSTGPSAAPTPPQPRFRVRVKQQDGPRSRSIELAARSAQEACRLALAQAGKGWEAVTAEPL